MTTLYRHVVPIVVFVGFGAIVGRNVAADITAGRVDLLAAIQVVLMIGAVGWSYVRGRMYKEVWLKGEVLEVGGDSSIARVPLTAVHWVELISSPIVSPVVIRLRVDPSAGAGNLVCFIPDGSNITGGGGELAVELRQLVSGAVVRAAD